MRTWLFGFSLLILAGGYAALIRAADEPAKAIFSDPDTQELQGNATYEKSFTAKPNLSEYCLTFQQKLQQQSSGRYWSVALNGKLLGRLEAHRPQQAADASFDGFHHLGLAVPAETLKDGENVITFQGNGPPLELKKVQLYNRSLQETLQLGTVTAHVVTRENGKKIPIPARLTIVNQLGELVKLYDVRTPKNAVRPGILYTLGSGDNCKLPAGKYTLYATRGMEWSAAKATIELKGNESQSLTLELKREVDTTGFVACDSHIHTLPGSGHGNATYQERMITIAGEGIEVAVATDHNHITDYTPHQHATGTHSHFHAIPGDEVTTHNGHFTAFPLDAAQPVPGGVQGRNPLFLKVEDWTELLADMRSKGAQVVVLNHPYWPTIPEGPFGRFHFDRKTGGRETGPEFTFDGIEVAQPANKTPDPYYALEDWLTLLNRGTRLTAVGATDSHTVNDPVGQARTYLESRFDDVAQIDRTDVYRAFIEGRASVAAGIFAKLSMGEKSQMGDIVPMADLIGNSGTEKHSLTARLRVASPAWVTPKEALLYVNGERVARQEIATTSEQPTDVTLEFKIPVPRHDAHVVAFVLGEPITLPGWTTFGKATQAITNPIYLDADNDKKYRSPRETASRLLKDKKGGKQMLSQADREELLGSLSKPGEGAIQIQLESILGDEK